MCALLYCFGFVEALAPQWGFFSHKKINELAIYLLPPEMLAFYKAHAEFIVKESVAPDERRYAVKGEAPRHFIDMDIYGDSAWTFLPTTWDSALAQYPEDTLMAYGIVPWHLAIMQKQLTWAFRNRDAKRILRLSAEIGHYIGDANVPLHTTENYNGQLTGQHGIHGLWESRVPELFAEQYDFIFDEKAAYEPHPQKRAWEAVTYAHIALDSVLTFEKMATELVGAHRKFSIDERGNANIRTYSTSYTERYHQLLGKQVERQMRRSIKMVADFWFTAWANAGRPPLDSLNGFALTPADLDTLASERRQWRGNRLANLRFHEGDSVGTAR